MENLFYIGQKVVCINDNAGFLSGQKQLVKGKIYTIESIFKANRNSVDLIVNGCTGGWDSSRFRAIQEISDMTFEEAIELVTEKVTV